MDSLRVINLVRQLQSSLREYNRQIILRLISLRTLYSNLNISRLAIAVQYLAHRGEAASKGLEHERVRKME